MIATATGYPLHNSVYITVIIYFHHKEVK